MTLTKEMKSCYELARRFTCSSILYFPVPVPQPLQQILIFLVIVLRLNFRLDQEMDPSLTEIKKVF